MRSLKIAALLAGLFICVSAAAARAQASPSPVVTMSITLPDGQVKEMTTHESGLAVVTSGGHEYGFRPTMHDDQGTRMTITIFDMGNASEAVREIGIVDVKGGGPVVATKTTPSFKVQARKGAGNSTT
jgi:hypothetical protein